MTIIPSRCVWRTSALAILLAGCGQQEQTVDGWVSDVQVTGSEWDPLPETITVPAGHPLDVTLSFAWTSDAGMIGESPVRPAAEWAAAATVLTEDDELAVPSPINSFARELYDVSRVGSERLQSDQSLVWSSPEPPQDMQPGRRYFWGRVRMPDEPGTYRLVLNVYPTARNEPTQSNPEFGPAEELYSTVVHIHAATEPAPSVVSSLQMSNPGIRRMIANERAGQ